MSENDILADITEVTSIHSGAKQILSGLSWQVIFFFREEISLPLAIMDSSPGALGGLLRGDRAVHPRGRKEAGEEVVAGQSEV